MKNSYIIKSINKINEIISDNYLDIQYENHLDLIEKLEKDIKYKKQILKELNTVNERLKHYNHCIVRYKERTNKNLTSGAYKHFINSYNHENVPREEVKDCIRKYVKYNGDYLCIVYNSDKIPITLWKTSKVKHDIERQKWKSKNILDNFYKK